MPTTSTAPLIFREVKRQKTRRTTTTKKDVFLYGTFLIALFAAVAGGVALGLSIRANVRVGNVSGSSIIAPAVPATASSGEFTVVGDFASGPPCVCTTTLIDPVNSCEALYGGGVSPLVIRWYISDFSLSVNCRPDLGQWWEDETHTLRADSSADFCSTGDNYASNKGCGVEWASDGTSVSGERAGIFIGGDIAITRAIYVDSQQPSRSVDTTCSPGEYINIDVYTSSTNLPDTSYTFNTVLMSQVQNSQQLSAPYGPGPGPLGSPIFVNGNSWITFAINNNVGSGPGCFVAVGDRIENWGLVVEYRRIVV